MCVNQQWKGDETSSSSELSAIIVIIIIIIIIIIIVIITRHHHTSSFQSLHKKDRNPNDKISENCLKNLARIVVHRGERSRHFLVLSDLYNFKNAACRMP